MSSRYNSNTPCVRRTEGRGLVISALRPLCGLSGIILHPQWSQGADHGWIIQVPRLRVAPANQGILFKAWRRSIGYVIGITMTHTCQFGMAVVIPYPL